MRPEEYGYKKMKLKKDIEIEKSADGYVLGGADMDASEYDMLTPLSDGNGLCTSYRRGSRTDESLGGNRNNTLVILSIA